MPDRDVAAVHLPGRSAFVDADIAAAYGEAAGSEAHAS